MLAAVGLLVALAGSAFPVSAHASTLTIHWSKPAPLLSLTFPPPSDTNSLACPTASFCAAGSDVYVWDSSDPTAVRSWRRRRVEPATVAVSYTDQQDTPETLQMPNDATVQDLLCPSATLCLGLDSDDLVVSSQPLGGRDAWRRETPDLGDNPSTGACGTPAFCALVDPSADVEDDVIFLSTDPAAPHPVWRTVDFPTATVICGEEMPSGCESALVAIACPSAQLCVATDNEGQVLSSTEPAVGSSWRAVQAFAPDPDPLYGTNGGLVSCPSRRFCAIWENETLLTSTDPGSTGARWTSSRFKDVHGVQLTCASARLCVMSDGDGEVEISFDPAATHPQWTIEDADPTVNRDENAYSVACPTARLCLMIDPNGDLLVGRARR